MPARWESSSGWALPEVVVSAAIFVTLAAGVAPLLARAVTVASRAREQTMTTVLATSKLEQLRGLTWSVMPGGASTLEPMTDTITDLSIEPAGRTGPGLLASPADSLLVSTRGYVDFLDVNGMWVGNGLTAPDGAHYVRRWAITPWPPFHHDALVLEVMVSTLRADLSAGVRSTAAPREGDTWLFTIHTRVLR